MKITSFSPCIITKDAQGEKITHTGSSVATMMVSPSGFAINVGEHIRKQD